MISEHTIEKKKNATAIIKFSLANAKNPCVYFSGGKSSLVLLHLIKLQGSGTVPVIHIDTGVEFSEVNSYIQKMKKLWRLDLILGTHEEKIADIVENPQYCCEKLKYKPLLKIIQQKKFDCIILGNTSDETEIFSNILVANPKIKIKIVQPLVTFSNNDIWNYIRTYNLPYCSLYDNGYVKIDCKPCRKIDSNPQTRISDGTDEKQIKEKLKKLGYL